MLKEYGKKTSRSIPTASVGATARGNRSYSLILASTAADQAQSTIPKRKATLDCSFG